MAERDGDKDALKVMDASEARLEARRVENNRYIQAVSNATNFKEVGNDSLLLLRRRRRCILLLSGFVRSHGRWKGKERGGRRGEGKNWFYRMSRTITTLNPQINLPLEQLHEYTSLIRSENIVVLHVTYFFFMDFVRQIRHMPSYYSSKHYSSNL